MNNLELLDRAAGAAACQTLGAAGTALVGTGAVGIVAGGVGFVPFTAGMVSLLAANYLCPDMPLGDGAWNDGFGGCVEVDGYGTLQILLNGQWLPMYGPGATLYQESITAVELLDVTVTDLGGGQWASTARWRHLSGESSTASDAKFGSEAEARAVRWKLDPTNGECGKSTDDLPPIPPEAFEPISYTDNITNCNYNVTLQGFAQPVPDGPAQPVYLIEGATEQRSDGGRMGGCNFPPSIYMPGGGGGNGGGGGVYLPVPDGPLPGPGPGGVPWWAAPLLGGSTSAALNLIGDALKDLLRADVPEGSFTLQAPCDFDAEGQPLTQTWTYEKQKADERMLAHQITILEALQTHLNWKTPTCGSSSEKLPLEGQWVTTRWESVEKMAHSGRRLRKLFRYRTKSTRDVGQLSAYWEAFTWQAGHVCVRHTGAWWGDPQVWAATQEEGQRVIRFAAAEAGIDPDQDGQWRTSSSRSPRYGMSGTMKVARFEGFPWVASRDGAEWPNVLAKLSDP